MSNVQLSPRRRAIDDLVRLLASYLEYLPADEQAIVRASMRVELALPLAMGSSG